MSFVRDDITYKFQNGDSINYKICEWRNIEGDLPEKPGLYTWRMRVVSGSEEKAIYFLDQLFNSRQLNAEVSGNLQLKYKGQLSKENLRDSNNLRIEDLKSNEILKDLLPLTDIPLYIGISINLSRRLVEHKNQIIYYSENSDNNMDNYNMNTEVDSDLESKCFGQRIANFWKYNNYYDKNCLYIKYKEYEYNKNIFAKLRSAEYYLNRITHPILGRR